MDTFCPCGARAYPATGYLDGEPKCERHYREAVALVEASDQVIRSEDDPVDKDDAPRASRLKAA